jgi:putative transposase
VISQAVAELEPLLPVKAACKLVGQPRSTLYRLRNPGPQKERQPPQVAHHPAALSPAERAQLLAVLDGQQFADKSPAQVWAILLDEGTYLASVSTMYRVLRAEGQVRERRAQGAHPPRVRPELVATGPSQVWSWDITKKSFLRASDFADTFPSAFAGRCSQFLASSSCACKRTRSM